MSISKPRGRGHSVLGNLFRAPTQAARGALLDTHLQDFLYAAQCEGLAASTLVKLQRLVTELAHWLSRERQCTWRHASEDDLRKYLSKFTSASASTMASRRWMLKRLYRWALNEQLVETDITSRLASMRTPPLSRPYAPTESQVDRLLSAPNTATALGLRDRAVLELLYATGLRADELVGLRMHQLQRAECAIAVTGKGARERLVIYGEHAGYWLEEYLRRGRDILLARAKGERETDAVFVHPTALMSMRYSHLRQLVRKHAESASLALVTPHVLRHAFATHLKDRGMNLRSLQTLLGHSTLSTTTVYIRTRMSVLCELIERHHPRGRNYRHERDAPCTAGSVLPLLLAPAEAEMLATCGTELPEHSGQHVSSAVLPAQSEHVVVSRTDGAKEEPGRADRQGSQSGGSHRAGRYPRPNRRVRAYGPRSLPMARAQEKGSGQVLRRADRSDVVRQRQAAQMDPGQGP